MKNKIIIVRGFGGMGNQIFFAIFSAYLKYKYGCFINISFIKSAHYNAKYPKLTDYLQNLNQGIKEISLVKMRYLKKKHRAKTISKSNFSFQDLPPKLNQTIFFSTNPFRYCYKMFDSLPAEYKQFFTVNEKFISPPVRKLSSQKYIAVNIRYGDKLCFAVKEGFLLKSEAEGMHLRSTLYTPEFYIQTINQFQKSQGLPVYIITDSPQVVNEFIVKKLKGAKVLNIPYWEGFYILTRAFILIGSHSTFSFSAGYLNPGNNIHLVKKPELDMENYKLPEDDSISPSWNIIDNKEFILNYNQPLARKMAEHFGRCSYYKNWYKKQGGNFKNIKKYLL